MKTPLSSFQGDACYACPTNKEQNSIHAAIFKKHIQATHPNVTSNEMPPEHTLMGPRGATITCHNSSAPRGEFWSYMS